MTIDAPAFRSSDSVKKASFNVPYHNHFRVTTLPDATTLRTVFQRIDELLKSYASSGDAGGMQASGYAAAVSKIGSSSTMFK